MTTFAEPSTEIVPIESAMPVEERPTILIVDDSRISLTVVRRLIEANFDCDVETAENGKLALKYCRKHTPAAVITDMQMPEMDGLELVEALKEDLPGVPVILMTAEGSEDIALRALRAGAVNYVPKQHLARDLPSTITHVLKAARVDRRKQRLLNSLGRRESEFILENDATVVPLLVAMFQEELSGMGLCTSSTRIRIGVALEESLLNALYHGNLEVSSELRRQDDRAYYEQIELRRKQSPYKERRVRVAAKFTRDEARFVIRDEGPGFDVSKLPDPSDPANLEKPSGRGILLIRTFMDEAIHNERGNELTLVKKRPG